MPHASPSTAAPQLHAACNPPATPAPQTASRCAPVRLAGRKADIEVWRHLAHLQRSNVARQQRVEAAQQRGRLARRGAAPLRHLAACVYAGVRPPRRLHLERRTRLAGELLQRRLQAQLDGGLGAAAPGTLGGARLGRLRRRLQLPAPVVGAIIGKSDCVVEAGGATVGAACAARLPLLLLLLAAGLLLCLLLLLLLLLLLRS